MCARPYKRGDSSFWWIAPVIDGEQKPRSSKTTDYQEALDMLRKLEGKIAEGLITASTEKILFSELCKAVERDYSIKDRGSKDDMERLLRLHVKPFLGDMRAASITLDTINEYKEHRLREGAARATINNELAAINRAFSLGQKLGAIITVPYIEKLPVDNVRQGYFTEPHFRSVLRFANPLLKDVLIVAFYTGWRINSILNLEWGNIDEAAGVMRLRANQTKNRKATTFPLEPFPELQAAIARRKKASKGLITPWVFHRKGERARSIRKGWEIARFKAKVPGRLIHDFRRTAVRNLKKMGWSDTEVMNMVGLRTLSMLIRYGITTEGDILEKAKAMAQKAAH